MADIGEEKKSEPSPDEDSEELSEEALDEASGGYGVRMRQVLVSSYQTGGSDD